MSIEKKISDYLVKYLNCADCYNCDNYSKHDWACEDCSKDANLRWCLSRVDADSMSEDIMEIIRDEI